MGEILLIQTYPD